MDSTIARADIANMVSRIRTLSGQVGVQATKGLQEAPASRFSSILQVAENSIKAVNASQNRTESLKNAWLSGDSNTPISQVMLASVQSKVAFEGLLAVRNKLLEAYREIMSMPL